jgi:hypothetical protein
MSKVILKIKSLQQKQYFLRVVPDLYLPLYNCPNIIYNDDKLFNISLTIEPREKN